MLCASMGTRSQLSPATLSPPFENALPDAAGAGRDQCSLAEVSTGTSKVTGHAFNIAVAFDPSPAAAPRWRNRLSTISPIIIGTRPRGCPSFVSEAPGNALAHSPEARQSIRHYAKNLALWLAGRS
jgi:hypothetical protein